MGLTGLNNFSIPIQNALTNDGYKGGELTDISVTGLIEQLLEKAEKDERKNKR